MGIIDVNQVFKWVSGLGSLGKLLMVSSVVLIGWLIWKMIIEALERLANALSRISEALAHIMSKLVSLFIVIVILIIFLYGAFFSSGVKGIKASKEGNSVSVQVEQGKKPESGP